MSRRALVIVTLALLPFPTLDRVWLFGQSATAERLYFGPDVHADGLLVGCLVGQLYVWYPQRLRLGTLAGWGCLIGLTVLAVSLREDLPAAIRSVFALTVITAVAGGLLISATGLEKGRLHTRLTSRFLRRLGRVSYALYLWH